MMNIREFTQSGSFVLVLLGLVAVLIPLGIDVFTDEIDVGFKFPMRKTIRRLFTPSSSAGHRQIAAKLVDWERYRRDLEEFTAWADGRSVAVVSHPTYDPAVIEVPVEKKTERRIWSVPVTSCTVAASANRERGYVFISGFDHPFDEGTLIAPTQDRCGYEIVKVGERSVWFRAVFETEGDSQMGIARFPEFTRVDGESLVRGSRKYVARDAFALASGGWLMIDSFLPPDGTVFKIIDENYREVASLLCVIIGEKGGK